MRRPSLSGYQSRACAPWSSCTSPASPPGSSLPPQVRRALAEKRRDRECSSQNSWTPRALVESCYPAIPCWYAPLLPATDPDCAASGKWMCTCLPIRAPFASPRATSSRALPTPVSRFLRCDIHHCRTVWSCRRRYNYCFAPSSHRWPLRSGFPVLVRRPCWCHSSSRNRSRAHHQSARCRYRLIPGRSDGSPAALLQHPRSSSVDRHISCRDSPWWQSTESRQVA